MNIGVIIVFYNNEETLQNSCFFNEKLKYPHLDICLVNNGSTDATLIQLKNIKLSFKSYIEVIDIKKNISKAQAIRAGERFLNNTRTLKRKIHIDFSLVNNSDHLNKLVHQLDLKSY